MTETMTRPRVNRRARALPLYLVAIAAWLAFTVAMTPHLADFPRAEFKVRNDTDWNLTLHVRTAGAITPIMTIDEGRERVTSEVIVPGETWHFIWRFEGEDVGTSTVAHDDLRRSGFELTVPDEVARALRASGATPSP